MSKFDNYSNQLEKERTVLIILIVVLIVGFSTNHLVQVYYRHHTFKSLGEFTSPLLLSDVCRIGMISILKKDPSEVLVTNNLIKALEEASFKYIVLDYKKESQVKEVKLVNPTTCRVILKDDTKEGHGLIGYKVTLSQSDTYEFNTKISDIDEVFVSRGTIQHLEESR